MTHIFRFPISQGEARVSPVLISSHKISKKPYVQSLQKKLGVNQVIIDIDKNVFNKLNSEEYLDSNIIEAEFPDISDQGRLYNVDVNTLVDEVIISPYAEPWIEQTVRSVVQRYGFNFEVNPSTLLDDPTF